MHFFCTGILEKGNQVAVFKNPSPSGISVEFIAAKRKMLCLLITVLSRNFNTKHKKKTKTKCHGNIPTWSLHFHSP
jgi:hypothetical protein